jgi:hypothetical protein
MVHPYDVSLGSKADLIDPKSDFCFTPENGHAAPRSAIPFGATSGLPRCDI